MQKRIFLLLGILLFVGFVTQAFSASARAKIQPLQSPSITRAGAVAILIESDPELKTRARDIARHMPPLPLFDDMDQQQWYAPYVEVAFEHSFVLGNEERRFRPSDFMTPEEALTLITRYRNGGETQFQYDHGDQWFTATVAEAQEANIPVPASMGTGKPITRTELFAMMRAAGILNPEQVKVPSTLFLVAYPQTTVVAESDFTNVIDTMPSSQPAQQAPQTGYKPTPTAANTTPHITPLPSGTPYRAPVQQPTQARPVQTTPAPTQVAAAPAAKPFSISMPSLGINDLTVSHPSDATTSKGLLAPLQAGVGHLFSYPGKGGKILIYGHSSSYPWDVSKYTKIFRQINKLNVGDKISVTYNGTVYNYEVTYKEEVAVNDMSAYSGAGEELILYTCWPPDTIDKRYLVHAKPI